MGRKNLLFRVALGALVAGLSAAAQGQTEQPQTDRGGADDVIVVTAFKREQQLQDIPASISAFSGEDLAERGVGNLQDLSNAVPNLIVGEFAGTTLVTIRGVGSSVDSGVTEPTVAMYVDGIALPRSTMAKLRTVDIERVEVLRGPQGTLYGRNATGGAINFISAAPSETFKGKVELSTGSRDAWGLSGYISGPLADGVYVRLSGGREKEDGYVKVVNTEQRLVGVNATYGRLAVRLEPSSDLTIDLSARYERNTAAVGYQQYIGPSLLGADVATSEPNRIIANQPFSSRKETFVASGTLEWSASDNLTLRSITGYIDHRSHDRYDGDASAVPFYFVPDFSRPSKSFSQELTLLGSYDNFDFILGGYYFNEKYRASVGAIFEPVGAAAAGVPEGSFFNLLQSATINNYAAFGDLTYHLTEQFHVNVGLRVNVEDNSFGQGFQFVPIIPLSTATLDANATKLLPKVALLYDFTPDVHGYAQWTRGYKSGGGNLGAPGGIVPLYKPENLDAYELGLKSQLFNGALTANLAAFYYKYDDLQIFNFIPPNTSLVQNADARLYGVEADFRLEVGDHLTMTFAPTWIHGRFHEFVAVDQFAGGAIVDLDGSPLPRSPNLSINAGVEGRFELGGKLLSELKLAANVRYNSTTVLRYFNQNPLERQPGYAILDLSATLTDDSERTRLSAFVNNVTDKVYRQSSFGFDFGYLGNFSPPRTWGLRLSREF